LVDAIIYGRDLGQEGDEYVSEERFEKIKYYLKNAKYPNGADRAEKSRLRSAATHYKLIPATENEPEKLMLKDKEVISDPQKQYELARKIHLQHHGGINKTTASIAEKYHWVRIKDTVSQVIKNCPECRDQSKQQPPKPDKPATRSSNASPVPNPGSSALPSGPPPSAARLLTTSHVRPSTAQSLVNYEVPVDPRIMEGIQPSFVMGAQTLIPNPILQMQQLAARQDAAHAGPEDEEGEFTRALRSAAFTLDS
jgi:H2C2 zinc finger